MNDLMWLYSFGVGACVFVSMVLWLFANAMAGTKEEHDAKAAARFWMICCAFWPIAMILLAAALTIQIIRYKGE